MYNEITLLGIGFVLGLGHALDADHLVAVSALVSKHKSLKGGMIAGISWGLGHT
jgi:high-affinity nickel permease